ncbi:MAG: hypothetical protein QOI86_5071, partial [Actinomycetota bacterium]|nr:hypothetical protein [Actinomycetota bacterium]
RAISEAAAAISRSGEVIPRASPCTRASTTTTASSTRNQIARPSGSAGW